MSIWILLYALSAPFVGLDAYRSNVGMINDNIGDNTNSRYTRELNNGQDNASNLSTDEDLRTHRTTANVNTTEDDEQLKQDDVGVNDDDDFNKTDIRTELSGLLAEFCPGGNVCADGILRNLSAHIESMNHSSCCTACSCLDTCHASQNCCFPLPDIYNEKTKHTRCYSTLYPALDDSEKLGYESYRMVDSEHFDGNETSMSTCGNANVAPWGSIYPVYSKSRRMIYKNSACAAAYGVVDSVRWKVYLACSHTDYLSKGALLSNTAWNAFVKRCDVWFEFPGESLVLQEHLCFKNLVSFCPETISVSTLMPRDKLIAACYSDFMSPYRGTDSVMYKNVFCSVCNGKYNQERCPYDDESKRKHRDYMALLDDSTLDEFNDPVVFKSVRQACLFKKGVIVESTCRPVMCPTGQTYTADGMCVFILKTWYKAQIEVFLQLRSDVLLNTTDVTERSLTSRWSRQWNLRMAYYFPINSAQPMITDKILVLLGRKFEFINPKNIMNNVYKLKDKNWTVQIANASWSLTADFMDVRDNYILYSNIWSLPEIDGNRRLQYIYNAHFNERLGTIIVGHMSYCEQVYINTEEFSIHSFALYNNLSGMYLIPGEFYFPGIRDHSLVRVCIENSGLRLVRNGCPVSGFTTCIFIVYMTPFFSSFYIHISK